MDRGAFSSLLPPDPVSFVIPENQGYAMTSINMCEAAEFLMTKLEQVNLDDLDANDRKCPICWGEFYISDDMNLSHAPVKTVCGHIFGHKCITQCLDPLCFDRADSHDEELGPYNYNASHPEFSTSSCPKCRRVFYDECYHINLWYLRLCLWIWDVAYARVGVVRSEKEERSRKYLWEYVKFCELFEHNCTEEIYTDQLANVALTFKKFASSLKTTNPNLTPAQETRRQLLEGTAHELHWLMELTRRSTVARDGTFDLGTSRKFCTQEDWRWGWKGHEDVENGRPESETGQETDHAQDMVTEPETEAREEPAT